MVFVYFPVFSYNSCHTTWHIADSQQVLDKQIYKDYYYKCPQNQKQTTTTKKQLGECE